MDGITPLIVSSSDILNATKCDGTELTTNLFKDHKMSLIEDTKKQKLETYLRIRSVPNYHPNDRENCYQVIDSNTLLVIPPKGSNANKFGSDSDKKRFNFSKIFDERVDQSSVYDSCGLQIVKRFLSGQNGLLFAYGITSSGKSYTMRGTTANPGIIPRSLKTIFQVIGSKIVRKVPHLKPNTFNGCTVLSPEEQKLEEEVRTFVFEQNDSSYEMNSFRSQMSVINENSDQSILWDDVLHSTFRTNDTNIECSVWISFYEIYNETIYDLLELDIKGEKKHKILLLKDETNNKNYYVKGLRQICVSSAEEAYKVLLFGQNNLHISSTNLNKNSSRSHCAFTITLVSAVNGIHHKRPVLNMNHLAICDLAGAERSDKANNTGDRIKEAGKINGSLLSLSRCISTLRHNQKFEHDSSKQRFVNYRDSKLTKVFQPFLSGSGMAAMISTMNPSPNLFDETLFALKFTGVASQVIVSSEDQTTKFHNSLKRLTQIWMQSSQRWSNFAGLKPSKPSVSIIQTIREEDEEEDSEEDNQSLDLTFEGIEKKIGEITQMDLSKADPQEIEVLRTQIDFLVEKLRQTENDKFEMELEVRRQVVSEFNKLIKDMEEMADDKDRAKKKLEEMMNKRLITTENLHKKEKFELENKINSIETEKFEINEKLSQMMEESDKTYIKINELNEIIGQKNQIIEELTNQLSDLKTQLMECYEKIECLSSPIKPMVKDMSTSPQISNLIDANNSAINLIETTDANTSAIEVSTDPIVLSDKGVGNYFIDLKDSETSTLNIEMSDKNTSVSIESSNKWTSIQSECFDCFEDKQTETEDWSPSDNSLTLVDKSISTFKVETKDVNISPIVFSESKTHCLSPQKILVTKQEYNEMMDKINEFNKIFKEKEATIKYHQKQELESVSRIQELEKTIKTLKEDKLKVKPEFSLDQFKTLRQTNPWKTTLSTVSSTASSVSSVGSKFEDTNSIISVDSFSEKPKKSAKYSSRKRKPNISTENRYLNAVIDPLDESLNIIEEKCSQSSVNSESCIADEVGDQVFSTKKKSNRKVKRKANHSSENGDLKIGPESKRKRPPLKNLYSSPISPLLSVERITRSKARRNINF